MVMLVAAALMRQEASSTYLGEDLQVQEVLAIRMPGTGGRVPFSADPIAFSLATGSFDFPGEKSTVTTANGNAHTWEIVHAGKDGSFSGDTFGAGYAACKIHCVRPYIAIMKASGDSLAYVNGVPRVGDPYSYGYAQIPIDLKAGDNELVFPVGRGSFRLSISKPAQKQFLDMGDVTLPDEIVDKDDRLMGSAIVVNASEDWFRGGTLRTEGNGGSANVTVPPIPPLGVRKARFDIQPDRNGKAGDTTFHLKLISAVGKQMDDQTVGIRVRPENETHKVSFLSEIDGSVQYYGVVPPPKPKKNLAMVLSLHGAGVEAIGQAQAYSSKDWAYIVCPTNRRPFGFDWEDWGREDALEVLNYAKHLYRTDPALTYLTGHSMGGHGTWQLGALFPDHWAAIGPSAAWASFFSYVGVPRPKDPPPMVGMFQRANGTSDTIAFLNNYKSEGVYILHGDADDNVPVTEARNMKALLEPIVKNFGYHEQKGAGHWWDGPAAPGADCVDWPDMFDLFHGLKLHPEPVIDFTTSDLKVSAKDRSVEILQQIRALQPSHIVASLDADNRVSVTTTNVLRFKIDLGAFKSHSDTMLIDGIPLHAPSKGWTTYFRDDLAWTALPKQLPYFEQVGPFKEVFNQRPVLVYGTAGSPEEQAWALAKARFDSESFWYRGNASLDVVSDQEYLHGPYGGRNVVLYGNSSTNRAWKKLMRGCEIQAADGTLAVGEKKVENPDSAYLFVYREPGATFTVGAIGGVNLNGMRATNRLPYFTSGLGYPDWTVFSPDVLQKGMGGVIAAGYYAPNGKISDGDQVWTTP